MEGNHTNSHTLAGVYILTQRVQTWGQIRGGHIPDRRELRKMQTGHVKGKQGSVKETGTVNTNKYKNTTVHTNEQNAKHKQPHQNKCNSTLRKHNRYKNTTVNTNKCNNVITVHTNKQTKCKT